jgi:flagellar motility protein MotE (MotC chaperone)
MKTLDYQDLVTLRQKHPAWRFLVAEYAPLVASFLSRAFLKKNLRAIAQADLIEQLEDELFAIREAEGGEVFPRSAQEYLDDWASHEKGWLRKYYPPGTEEPFYDLTPATEKVLSWIEGLAVRSFVGTESRLMTIFELLRQIVEGSTADPQVRIAELQKRRANLEQEIELIRKGEIPLLDATSVKERFLQVGGMARELLSDFREVEHNFRALDRQVRERMTLWEGRKGELLEAIFGERDVIADSDQGRSFRAFWDFLMSSQRQEEFTQLLDVVCEMPTLKPLVADRRFRRMHYDWLIAGEHTQRTVAALSQQLRRYIDDRTYLENRRIIELLRKIEGTTLEVRSEFPEGAFMTLEQPGVELNLPFERPLFVPSQKPFVKEVEVQSGKTALATTALFEQVVVDKHQLIQQVRRSLQSRSDISLAEVLASYPLQHGLAELVCYLSFPLDTVRTVYDETRSDEVTWSDADGHRRRATFPRIIYYKS